MKKTYFLCSIILFVCINHTIEAQTKPNIVIIHTDDNDFYHWGFGGGPLLSPTIDRIAKEGIKATEYHVTSSVCTPSRYSLLTGKYAGRCEEEVFTKAFPTDKPYSVEWNTFIDAEKETIFPKILSANGYNTAFVGKWHLFKDVYKEKFDANENYLAPETDKKLKEMQADAVTKIKKCGFDYAASVVIANNDDHPLRELQYHNLDWTAKGAVDFINLQKKEKPFFMIVNTTGHHGPCLEESIDQPISKTYAGKIEGMEGLLPPRSSIRDRIVKKGYVPNFETISTVWTDDCVNAIFKALEKNKLDKNTVIIFISDHNRHYNKGTCYRSGTRTVFAMRYPGKIAECSSTDLPFQNIDLYPTLLDMANIKLPQSIKIDGKSVWDELLGKKPSTAMKEMFFEFGYARAIQWGRWRYIATRFPQNKIDDMKNGQTTKALNITGKQAFTMPLFKFYPQYFDTDQLYDIATDPDEQMNLANDATLSDTVQMLKQKLQKYTFSFRHPFDVMNTNEYFQSEAYKELVKKSFTPEEIKNNYWIQKKCY